MSDLTEPQFPGDRPEPRDVHLESALRGQRPAIGEPGLDHVADVMAVLREGADPGELVGFERGMAAYRRTLGKPRPTHRPRRLVMLSSLIGLKAAATATGVVAALGAVGAAVYVTTVAAPAHNLQVVTAATTTAPTGAGEDDKSPKPAKSANPAKTGTPVGPDAHGPAAFGLCTAWSHHQQKGATTSHSIAFRNLAKAAGGEQKIAAYCAKVPRPSGADAKNATKKPPPPATSGKPSSTPGAGPTTPASGN